MAETLTYDPGTDTVTEGEALTPAEQESLEVGQALEDSQEQLLAGKYENAQQLEKAYIELQKKLGENGEEENKAEAESEEVLPEEPEESTEEPSETAQVITSASDEFSENGTLSTETIEQLSKMDSRELVQTYMELQKQVMAEDLSDAAVNDIKNSVGGEQTYTDIVNWATTNLDQNSIEAFDNLVNQGDPQAIQLAVNGLKAQYDYANGFEGKMVTGKAPVQTKDAYKSQAELVAAMGDPRYDKDPAYRQGVLEKLERSDNLQF